jgi:hypothetical protein
MDSEFKKYVESLNKQLDLYRSVRKDLLKGTRPIKHKKDKLKELDKRKGRKNWKDDTHE